MKEEDELRAYLNRQGINLENFLEEALDADEYFKENAQAMQKIDTQRMKNVDLRTVRRLSQRDSVETLSEEEAYHFLSGRGFGDEPITTNYSMEGASFDAVEISDQASTHHPCYQTKHVSDTGECWTVSIIGKDITAYPFFFNLKSSLGAELIVAESEIVTSYDSATNTFYKSIPKESALIVKLVNHVDKETLNGLTAEVMGL